MNADKYDGIREQEKLRKELSGKIEKFNSELVSKKRKLGTGKNTWDDLKDKVERLTKKLKDLRKELEDARKGGSKCSDEKKQAETELADQEKKLAELIASRERQPLGKLKKGLEIQYWDASNRRKPGETRALQAWYDKFNFENPQNPPDKVFMAPFLRMPEEADFKTFWGKKELLGTSFRPKQFLFKATGVFHAPKDDKYTFEVVSDDGSYLYFGEHAHENDKAVLNNGGFHGMVTKRFTFPMKKDQEQRYVLTFWQHEGPCGVRFRMYDSKKRQIHGAFKHFDTSMQRV